MQMIEYFQLISIAQKRMTFSLGKYCRKASFHSEKKCNYRFLRNSLDRSKKKTRLTFIYRKRCVPLFDIGVSFMCVCVSDVRSLWLCTRATNHDYV